jgi:hypothetical protein
MDGIGTGRGAIPKPAWSRLYFAMALALAALGAGEMIVPVGAARTVMEVLAALIVVVTMKLWLRANRIALELQGHRDCGWRASAIEAPVSTPASYVRGHRVSQSSWVAARRRPASREEVHRDGVSFATRG